MRATLWFCLITAAPLAAQDAPPITKSSDYVPASKSEFVAEGIKRNPFIPIDYKAKGPDAPKPEAPPALTPESFKLSSIFLGPQNVAVINGADITEKQWFIVNLKDGKGERKEQVFLYEVRDGSVVIYHPKVGYITVLAR